MPFVTMVEAANLGVCHDARAFCGCLDRTRRGRVLGQRQVCARPMVIDHVSRQDAPQVPLVEDDEMVQALAADGSDQSLGVRILPGAPTTVYPAWWLLFQSRATRLTAFSDALTFCHLPSVAEAPALSLLKLSDRRN